MHNILTPRYYMSRVFSAKAGDKFALKKVCVDPKSLPKQLSCKNVANWKSCSIQTVFLVNTLSCFINIKDNAKLRITLKSINNHMSHSYCSLEGDTGNIDVLKIQRDAKYFVTKSGLCEDVRALSPSEKLDYSKDFSSVPIPEYWKPDITIDTVSSQYALTLQVTPMNDKEKPFELDLRERVEENKLLIFYNKDDTHFDVKTMSQDTLTCLYDSHLVQKGVEKSSVKVNGASNVLSTDAVSLEEKPLTTQKQSSTEETLESAKVNTLN